MATLVSIDLRSDTVTKPTPEMLAAMMAAEVGDDVFGEDPSVISLQEKAASQFGMEAGLFCPSGTMTNQIALRVLTKPQDEIIADQRSHIYRYEGGGVAYNSLTSLRLVDGDRGRLTADHVNNNVNPDDIHFPRTSLVSLENTMNKGGGAYYTIEALEAIHAATQKHGLALHLDGARVFNALVETGDNPKKYGSLFNTISVCLSKGLGAPVGSLLLGSKALIHEALRVRKVFGGGMRQAGFLAAAGIYALEHHVERLTQDHQRARALGELMKNQPYVTGVMPVDTNIVIFELPPEITATQCLEALASQKIKAVPFGKHLVRLVTHLDFTDDMLNEFNQRLKSITL